MPTRLVRTVSWRRFSALGVALIAGSASCRAAVEHATGSASDAVSAGAAIPFQGAITPEGAPDVCVDLEGGSANDGVPIQVWSCSGGPAQSWTFAGGMLQVQGKCLAVVNGVDADGTQLQAWDCNASDPNEQWTRTGTAWVWTGHGKCIDLTAGNQTNGTPLQIWDCVGNANQRWVYNATPKTDSPPDISIVGVAAARTWASSRVADAEASYAASGLTRLSSPSFWGTEIVYGVQVDRFNDGDLGNDPAPLPADQLGNIPDARHGGDLAGITARLDYVNDLGATALWLTPVFTHNGAYHGYCPVDPTSIDPGFGSKEDLRTLVSEAHSRGIKVILDIVVNHLCDNETIYDVQPNHEQCATDLSMSYWNGGAATSGSQGELAMSGSFFPLFRSQALFNRCGANSSSDTDGDGPAALFGDFTDGMFDYNTQNRDFQSMFTDLHKWWIAYADVDGFRLDAAKHVTEDYLAYFSTEIRSYAQTLGKDNFYIVGEVASDDPQWIARRLGNMLTNPNDPTSHGTIPPPLTTTIETVQSTYLADPAATFPGLNGIYDFTSGGDSRSYLWEQASGAAVAYDLVSPEHVLLAGQSDPRLNLSILEIQDWVRFASQFPTNLWKSKVALGYLATAPGIPVIFYGMEQGFNGTCEVGTIQAGAGTAAVENLCLGTDDALKRQDMFVNGPWRLGSTVPEIDALSFIGAIQPALSPAWTSDPMLVRDHDVYLTARRFNRLRRSCSPLNRGLTELRTSSSANSALLIFSRIDASKEMVVVVNNTSASLPVPDVTLDPGSNTVASQVYCNALNTAQTATATGTNLSFGTVQVDGNSVAVFAPDANLAPADPTLRVRLCND